MGKRLVKMCKALLRMGAPEYASSTEEEFCKRWVFNRWYSLVTTGYIVAVGCNVVVLATFHLYAHPQVINIFYALHAVYLGLLIGCYAFFHKKDLFVKYVTLFSVTFVLFYNYGIYSVLKLNDFQRFLHVCLGSIAIASFAVQLLSLTSWRGLLAVICYVIGIYMATKTEPKAVIVTGIFAVVLGFSFVMRQRLYLAALSEAKREFKMRSQIAPAHIVRKTIKDNIDVNQVFAPESKFCVCLSSDWRSYQKLSQLMSNQELSSSLGSYYDLCENLLEEIAPMGNFYSDWIADELFVVMYQSESESQISVVKSAMIFAYRLIMAKQDFYRTHGLPNAIDIGIASGNSLIGMMGPKSHRKATALGTIPGRSRRYQSIGKQLRDLSFQTDRIIFDEKLYKFIINEPYQVKTIEATLIKGVKDIYEDNFYYIEPVVDQKMNVTDNTNSTGYEKKPLVAA